MLDRRSAAGLITCEREFGIDAAKLAWFQCRPQFRFCRKPAQQFLPIVPHEKQIQQEEAV